ncbi:acyl-CoA dehydrogenase [Nonomuraea sp. NN258]|uniref:acyl-CoA dehydrogenase family protein n=1 Tax=Nonomuraea antri TaxID=2730852 RepID=UPI0015690171|nr:acyl-CoA dehydrogenase family protein [Nonomuraea antri]NRQ36500.1 acyl-CoA dehydrogenase [Nonomuraea antri]
MLIDLTSGQRRLRDELREYFQNCLTEDDRAKIADDPFGKAYMDHCRRLGRDGKLGLGWPKEYGGGGYGPLEQQIFANEIARAGVPYPIITVQTVGPTLMQYGTQAQKEEFLPRILAGECHFAIGYSEPEAGTDLASLRTTAVLDGDHYVVNGQKIFTSGAHYAQYIWLATRTNPAAKKHKGITMMIASTADPGFSWTPIVTMDGRHHTNATYYSDVRVPADMVVGEVDKGWDLIVNQLNHERVTLGPAGNLGQTYDRFLAWARRTGLVDQPDVRRALGRVRLAFRTNELLNWQVAANMDLGWLGAPDASATKIYGSERMQEIGRVVCDVLARYGDPSDPETAELMARMDHGIKGAVVLTFGGGVNEVQRELIAMLGLSLPRPPR